MEKNVYTNPTPQQLRAARIWLTWTLDDAAAASGLNRQTVSRVESGASAGTRETIYRLALAYSRAGLWMADSKILFEPPGED